MFSGDVDPFTDAAVRRDIATSWRRSLRLGVGPDSVEVPFDDSVPTPHRLLDAATSVIDRLASLLTHTSATILLANGDARIVQRWACRSFLPTLDRCSVAPGFSFAEHLVGTNGLGCALEEKRLFEVRGPEHFRESLQGLVCVAAPIVLPTTNVAQGALNVTCTLRDANGLLRPLIQQAVADIERRMLEASSARDRLVFDAFVAKARRAHGAVLALNDDFVMANPAADRLVPGSDRVLLWRWACEALTHRPTASRTLELTDVGTMVVLATKIGETIPPLGAVLELRPLETKRAPRAPLEHAPLVAAIPGRSPASQRLRRAAGSAACDRSHVVVVGPDGSGRTFVARVIATGCQPGAQPPALVDDAGHDLDVLADDGNRWVLARNVDTWDFGRVDELLARADRRHVRVVATARDNPDVSANLQRFDHRVEVPTLASRIDDLPELAALLMAELAPDGRRRLLRPATMSALLGHEWRGNVRELRSVLSIALAAAGSAEIELFHLPASFREDQHGARWTSIQIAQRNAILQALSEHDGNKVAAADALGLARSTLYRKLRTLHIDVS